MTRLALALLVVCAAGCGPLRSVLTPSLASVPGLSPDVTSEQDGSTVVVTGRSAGTGVSGRAIDRDTGEPIIGFLITSGDGGAVTDLDGAFRLASAGARIAGSFPGYLPIDAPLGGAAPGAPSVLVLLVKDPEAAEVVLL